jgi:hypothetical protein
VRRQIHFEPPAFGQAAHELSRLQKAGAQSFFFIQLTQEAQAALND